MELLDAKKLVARAAMQDALHAAKELERKLGLALEQAQMVEFRYTGYNMEDRLNVAHHLVMDLTNNLADFDSAEEGCL